MADNLDMVAENVYVVTGLSTEFFDEALVIGGVHGPGKNEGLGRVTVWRKENENGEFFEIDAIDPTVYSGRNPDLIHLNGLTPREVIDLVKKWHQEGSPILDGAVYAD